MPDSHDEQAISDEELLTGTGSGGVFTSGYLRDKPLIEYLGDSERVAHLLSNKKKGVRRESDDEAMAHQPGDGYQAIAAITDTRVMFVVGDCDGDGDEAFDVPYAEMEDVKTGRSVFAKYVDVWTTVGVRWRFFVRPTVDIEPAAEYLERAAVVWSRVESQLRHAKRALTDVTDGVTDGDHGTAQEAAQAARDHVEEAQRKATELTDNRADAIWEHIAETEQRLDERVLDIHVSRGDHQVEVAKEHWDDGEYNEAYDAFVAARNAYERALDVARERDIEAASQIREKADEVTTDIDDLSKSPLQLAEDAHERAMGVDDPTEAVERYEEALEKYQEAMVLDWGNDQQRFAGDSDRIREHVESIVDEIVSSRRTLAEQSRELGEGFMSEGQYERARAQFAQARDQVEAAYSVAEELRPGLTTDLSTDIRDLEERMETAVEQAGTAGFQFVGDVEDPTAPSSRPLTRQLTDLDEEAFDALVAGLWEDMDWQTSHGHEGPVDVLATRSDPIPERQLVLTVHCDGDDTCGADAIEAAVDVRDSDRDVDVVTVVTSGTCSDEARTMADEHNVKLVEGDQLTDLLDAEDLGDVTGTNQQPAAE